MIKIFYTKKGNEKKQEGKQRKFKNGKWLKIRRLQAACKR